MNVSIFIDCGNAAFEDDTAVETSRILRELANRMTSEGDLTGLDGLSLRDVNGNSVGVIDVNAD